MTIVPAIIRWHPPLGEGVQTGRSREASADLYRTPQAAHLALDHLTGLARDVYAPFVSSSLGSLHPNGCGRTPQVGARDLALEVCPGQRRANRC